MRSVKGPWRRCSSKPPVVLHTVALVYVYVEHVRSLQVNISSTDTVEAWTEEDAGAGQGDVTRLLDCIADLTRMQKLLCDRLTRAAAAAAPITQRLG
jgi:hypothetical protein